MKRSYRVIGMMSGTSLDGLDMAYCVFTYQHSKWVYEAGPAETVRYDQDISSMLRNCESGSALDLAFADTRFGEYCGIRCREFIDKYGLKPDFAASHGHTIFHRPEKKMTHQLGNGAALAALSGIPAVCDFRTTDVALGGQGAPLVPIGDRLLFGNYDYCLNLGGFSNISFENEQNRIACDISPCNIALNHFSRKLGKEYDENGIIALSGKLCRPLLAELSQLPYYSRPYPKSLGKEWLIHEFLPVIEKYVISPEDILHTLTEHIAIQVAGNLGSDAGRNALVTGGGAFNTYLLDRISAHTKCRIVIPDPFTISFKEAIVFAFLGLLRWLEKPNCLSSVTGAERNSTGGCIYL